MYSLPFIAELGILGAARWDLWSELHQSSLPCIMLSWDMLNSKHGAVLAMTAFCTSICSRDFTLAILYNTGYDAEDRLEIRRFFQEELQLHRQAAWMVSSVLYAEVDC